MKQDILIVGDSPEDIGSTVKILANLGHNVEGRSSIKELDKYLLDKPPSILYVIITNQNKLFFNLLTTIDHHSILSKIPKIIIAANKDKIEKRFRALNIKEYLYLPINSVTITNANKTYIKTKTSLNYLFDDTRRLKATFVGDIIKMNEISATLSSPVKFRPGQIVDILSEHLMKKLDFEQFHVRIFKESKYFSSKTYITELVILGLREVNTKKIRAILKT